MPETWMLRVMPKGQSQREIDLNGGRILIGRDEGDVRLNDPRVSYQHALLTLSSDGWHIEDVGSTNGTLVNGERIESKTRIKPGQSIQVGDSFLVLHAETRVAHGGSDSGSHPLAYFQSARPRLIGRSTDADIKLDEPIVSRRHASLEVRDGVPVLTDCGSANGTFVNGIEVKKAVLQDGDLISVGSTEFIWGRDGLSRTSGKGPMRLDVCQVSRAIISRREPMTLLDNVDFSVKPGEFVVVVGGSGTGKTSLFRALTGAQAPTSGCVMLNGTDYHQNVRLFAGQIGLVPQEDIVHPELTVWSALMYAAQLRLPKDTSTKERLERVCSVLDSVQLTNRAHSTIKHLSGGERKRVSIALELITEPNLLYLDEPTSGLDPHRERQIMELLQRLAKSGRTVLVTTHSTASLDLCDLLIVMGAGGRLVYFGPPNDALTHFGCTNYNAVYSVVGDAADQVLRQQHRFWKSDTYRQFGGRRGHSNCASSAAKPLKVSSLDVFRWLSQFWLLCRRYLEIVANDRTNVALLLAQAPLIVLIIIFVFPSNSFEAVVDSSGMSPLRYASPILFLLVISAIWFGTSNSVREIVKENPIYNRERMAFLRPSAYFLSKFAVLAVLCVVQCAILITGVGYWMSWFGVNDIDALSMFGVLLLASFVGLSMGLSLSSIARSSDQAVSLTPTVLIPQIVFSGLFIPDNAGAMVSTISRLHASKWAFGSMGHLARVSEKIDSLPVHIIVKNSSFEGDVAAKLLALVALLITTMIIALSVVSCRRQH